MRISDYQKRNGKYSILGIIIPVIILLGLAVFGITMLLLDVKNSFNIYKVTDPEEYGKYGDYLATQSDSVTVGEDVDGFMPERIEDYFSNPKYIYQACDYPVMYEIYLEFVIEDEAQFDAYVQSVVKDGELSPFRYAEGFEQYVLKDQIRVEDGDEKTGHYINATEIKKILFSDDTNTVIYISLSVPWPDFVFPAKYFVYFETFGIDVKTYNSK